MLKYTEDYIKIYGSFIMANIKSIQRTERIEFIVSKEEKDLIWKYAESMGIKPSRLIRNIVTMEQKAMRYINIASVKAYSHLELTDPEELKDFQELE